MDTSTPSGCHKVSPQTVARSGDVDPHGEIVDALTARITAAVCTESALPADQHLEGVARLLAVNAAGARSFWAWDA
jgi:hypothetical protein